MGLRRWVTQGLEDGVAAVGDGGHPKNGELGLGDAHVAREFGHGAAGAAGGVFADALAWKDFALQDDFGAGNGLGRDGDTVHQLHGTAPQSSGDGQFIQAERRSRRLEARGHVDGRIQADADRDWQRAAGGFGFGAELVDVAAGDEVDAEAVRCLEAEAVNRDVRFAGLGILGPQEAEGDVGSGVAAGVGDGGQQSAEIERRAQDDLLARGAGAGNRDWGQRVVEGIQQIERKTCGRASQQERGPLA